MLIPSELLSLLFESGPAGCATIGVRLPEHRRDLFPDEITLMDFRTLQENLIRHLKRRLSAGEITERRLARHSGISQPHLHNVLKGVRDLTPATADRVMQALSLDLLELASPEDLRAALLRRPVSNEPMRDLAVLAGPVGPGYPWPAVENPFERFPVPCSALSGLRLAVAARLAADPEMGIELFAARMAILDLGAMDPSAVLEPRALYVIDLDGVSLVRWLRLTRHGAYVFSAKTELEPLRWRRIELNRVQLRSLVKARVYFPEIITRCAAHDGSRRLPGIPTGPVRHSAAS